MSDISLTAAMRKNLSSLQTTEKLMERTQERLSTGKDVNSALDNATNYFTAQSHESRANDLLSFKDAISESIQTIESANSAIESISDLIDSAKAIAEDAKEDLTTYQTLQVTGTLTAGQTITIAGQFFTAVTSGSASATQFVIGSTDASTAASLQTAIAANTTASAAVTATVADDTLTITAVSGLMTSGTIQYASGLKFDESDIADISSKITQYNELMVQIDQLRNDAYYKGKNLLRDEDMTVRFGNNHTLEVSGFDASASSGLGLTTSASWTSETTIQADIDKMDAALTTLENESSKLSTNLSIVNVRDSWISNMADILQTGADNLTAADTTEEGANMLMLQTRQSLGTSALSMASSAAQSVLQLFS